MERCGLSAEGEVSRLLDGHSSWIMGALQLGIRGHSLLERGRHTAPMERGRRSLQDY